MSGLVCSLCNFWSSFIQFYSISGISILSDPSSSQPTPSLDSSFPAHCKLKNRPCLVLVGISVILVNGVNERQAADEPDVDTLKAGKKKSGQ